MAQCVTMTTIYAFSSNAAATRTPYVVPTVAGAPSGASSACMGYMLITPDEYTQYQEVYSQYSQPIDGATAGALWAFTFSTTVGLWLLAKNAGIIISAVRRF